MSKKILLFISLVASIIFAISCTGAGKGDIALRKVQVVATTGMIGDAAINIGGERADVTVLMGPGVDPHLYKATAGDVSRLSSADLILYNGLHLEGKMTEVFEKMEEQVTTVPVGENIPDDRLLTPAAFEGFHDPHVWFDVEMWKFAAEAVRDGYKQVDPTHAEIYDRNAEEYLAGLDALNTYVREQAESIPQDKRVLITAHDAFNYFGRAYGFEVRGLQGISTATEAGTGDVQQLSQFIADRKIPAIFVESSIPVRNVEAVREAVKARGFGVQIGGELFSDAMGDAGTEEGTYIGMVHHNIDTIVHAFNNKTIVE